MQYLSLDTNIILLDAQNLLTIGNPDDQIVLSSTTIDELDSKKSGFTEIAFQAREFGRLLASGHKRKSVQTTKFTYTTITVNTRTIIVVEPTKYPDFSDTEPNIIADRKIIHATKLWADSEPDVRTVFYSNDVMARLRAIAIGLETLELKQVETTIFEFTKHIEVPEDQFVALHNKSILDIDPKYKPENYNYVFTTQSSAQHKLAYIDAGSIQIIGKTTEDALRRQELNPLNVEQLFLSRAIQDTTIDIVVCDSLAGSGKTASSISNAMALMKKDHRYQSIIYIRNSVNDVDEAEEVGFLPGLETKFDIYLHPLYDTIDSIIRNKYKDSKLKKDEFEAKLEEARAKIISDYNIQAMTTLGMRGRTFTNCIAIIDECQGLSKGQFQKIITRFGKNVKVILIGSNRQIDNKYLTKYTNGLSVILNACAKPSDQVKLYAVTLQRVIRSKTAEWAELIFSKGH